MAPKSSSPRAGIKARPRRPVSTPVRVERKLIDKGLARGQRFGAEARLHHALAKQEPADPTACERCGAVYTDKKWQRPKRRSHELIASAAWDVCPACRQQEKGEFFGRVLLRGDFVAENEEAIRRRIRNVAARAEFTQPLRRVVSIDRTRSGLEVLTTSQKLAHRIAHELKKAFRGRTTYSWSDRDGALNATWEAAT